MSSGIEFEEDGFAKNYGQKPQNQSQNIGYSYNNAYSSNPEEKGMTGWLIKHNLAKSSGGAQLVLIGVVVVNIIITVVFLIFL